MGAGAGAGDRAAGMMPGEVRSLRDAGQTMRLLAVSLRALEATVSEKEMWARKTVRKWVRAQGLNPSCVVAQGRNGRGSSSNSIPNSSSNISSSSSSLGRSTSLQDFLPSSSSSK